MPKHDTVIHWFRRDFRLTDNPALNAAATQAQQVVPVYVLSDWQRTHPWTGPARQQFLCGCLDSLANNLAAMGSRLILRCGPADRELERLIADTAASAVFFNRDYDPFGRDMERRVALICRRLGIECHSFKDRVSHEPEEVLSRTGSPYQVFTPFSRTWLALPKPSPVGKPRTLGRPAPPQVTSLPVPGLSHWDLPATSAGLPAPGERAARQRLRSFTGSDAIARYADQRDLPAGDATSGLSQDLRFGLVSIRELHQRCAEAADAGSSPGAAESIASYVKELAWREFYQAVLWFHPGVLDEEFNPNFRGMPWPGTDDAFAAWSEGRTGFPIVDAGIRQMLQTGLMHNRVRMIVAMFLTKDLHCHWKLGESFFMQHLVDGEIASNNGGWQWSAGTGADAAPYFRIQNPWTQTLKFDPQGLYIRRWVPELRKTPAAMFLAPPRDGRPIANNYPLPIVDHAVERQRALARFGKAAGRP